MSRLMVLKHSFCGGVSDMEVTFKCFVHPQTTPSFSFDVNTLVEASPLSSLSSILDTKVRGSKLVTKPRLPILTAPKVCLVQDESIYHYKGLFPSGVGSAQFYIPCVFEPRRWVCRSLQPFEMLRVYDLPVVLEKALSHRQSKLLLGSLSLPCKCATAFTHALFLASAAGTPLGSDIVSNNGGGDDFLSSSPSSSLPIGWKENIIHDRDERAAKSDDARIPVELWDNHLAKMLGKHDFTIRERTAISTLRKIGLRVWSKSIMACFLSWLKCPKCHNERLKGRFKGCFIYENYDIQQHSSYCIQSTNKPIQRVVEWNGSKYVWVEKFGKKAYRRYWRLVLKGTSDLHRQDIADSILAFLECNGKAYNCSEWNWDGGSRLFFWRWGEHWKSVRDGAKVHVKGKLPACKEKQSVPKEVDIKNKIIEKLADVRSKGYIQKGKVKSLTSFFAVPKSDDDIRMVYNGTSSGLNDAVWAPWFALPTVDTHLRGTLPNTFMCDIDLSEMFLNFMLDKDIRAYAGVDLSKLFKEEIETGGTLWECWYRMLMGFKPSPYLTTRDVRRIEEFLLGDRHNPNNVFRWSKVVFNLPGSSSYNPSLPRVYRIRIEGDIAGDLFIYIDDLRVTCPTAVETWQGAHQVCCRLTWLGLQDAPRKRSPVSNTPRAWAGSIVHTDDDTVSVLIAQKKWVKAKRWIEWMDKNLKVSDFLNHKELERCRGFLIYVSRTYKCMKPYLRGLHMTIENWRGNRDDEGWKIIEAHKDEDEIQGGEVVDDVPSEVVKAVPRLKNDVEVLGKLLRSDAPPKVKRRRSKQGKAFYGLGDASGAGFGYAVEIDGKLYDEYGEWNAAISEQSSNYRELRNLKNAVERLAKEKLLEDAELYLFTDNYVAERAYYNGGSTQSKYLDGLVFELWDLQMHHDFDLFVYHIAGTRMIESGVDGLSRGDKGEGVSRGLPVLNYIPTHLTPFYRCSSLENWIYAWWNKDNYLGQLKKLTPEDWFSDYNKKGSFLWNVAPTAGEAAVEQLCAHTHAQPYATHIFVIPRLCTSHWRKQLMKACDCVITIQVGSSFWPTNMHEPLIMGIYFSLLPPDHRFAPWRLKHTKWLETRRCKMQEMQSEGDIYPVAKLDVGDQALEDPDEKWRYKSARNGDHLITPFQCDLCHFRNIYNRDPSKDILGDLRALTAIRRAILDSFWGRSENTVSTNKAAVKKIVDISIGNYGMAGVLPKMGPHPLEDEWGMGIALVVLRKSLDKGKHAEFVQYDTARRMRSAYSNVWGASIHAMTDGVMARDTMKTFLTHCPTYSLWFERFMRGMHSRMGDDHRPDLAFSKPVMHELMNLLNEDYLETETSSRKRYIARMGLLLLSTYLGGLRGEEVPRIVLKYFIELNMESLKCNIPHCVLPLYGRFKNNSNIPRCYLFRICRRSKSGFDMEKWVLRVIKEEKSASNLFLFSDKLGRKESVGKTYERYLFSLLKEIQDKTTGLIPTKLDVEEAYGISRSGRRGGTTNAQNAPNEECNDNDIERNNRWRTEEKAGNKKPSLSMIQLYTDSLYSLQADLRFSTCQ